MNVWAILSIVFGAILFVVICVWVYWVYFRPKKAAKKKRAHGYPMGGQLPAKSRLGRGKHEYMVTTW